MSDATNLCYELAFVALAYAKTLEIGITEAEGWLDKMWQLMELHFRDAGHRLYEHRLYTDEADATWQLSDYRGQNANMHACKAWLAAFEASGEQRYLDRAALLAEHRVNRQASLSEDLVWGHYRPYLFMTGRTTSATAAISSKLGMPAGPSD